MQFVPLFNRPKNTRGVASEEKLSCIICICVARSINEGDGDAFCHCSPKNGPKVLKPVPQERLKKLDGQDNNFYKSLRRESWLFEGLYPMYFSKIAKG